jgi:hypothetical protein
LLHTFSVKHFERLSHRFPRHAGLFHLLGEVEVVFGFWAMVLIVAMALVVGGGQALQYAESRNYTEPLFVFVVMVIAASRPVLRTVVAMVHTLARWHARAHPAGQRLAGAGGRAAAGLAHHRARGHDHCRPHAGAANLPCTGCPSGSSTWRWACCSSTCPSAARSPRMPRRPC